jgi:uncharacterized protein (TIGR02246 family)
MEASEAIRSLVEQAERSQFDVEEFIALHTADTIIVNFVGRRVLGRDELERAMKAALGSPLASVRTTTEIQDIRFVEPTVAIVSCIKHVFDERDNASEHSALTRQGSLTYVVVEQAGQWRIALAQTTPAGDRPGD